MAKTTAEKLAAAVALVAKLEVQLASEAIVNNVEVGDEVTIKYGRADTAKEVSGKVVGVKDGKVVVLSDEFKTYTVRSADIISNEAALARDAAAATPAVEETPQFADEDPLAVA